MRDDHQEKKLSWREIDRLKSKSGFSRIRKKYEKEERQITSSIVKDRYLKELEKLFKNKEEKQKEEAILQLKKAYGTKRFTKEVKKYLKEYGIPEDPSLLLLMLEVNEKDVLLEVFSGIKKNIELFKKDGEVKNQLISRLKAFSFSASDEIIAYNAEKLLKIIE